MDPFLAEDIAIIDPDHQTVPHPFAFHFGDSNHRSFDLRFLDRFYPQAIAKQKDGKQPQACIDPGKKSAAEIDENDHGKDQGEHQWDKLDRKGVRPLPFDRQRGQLPFPHSVRPEQQAECRQIKHQRKRIFARRFHQELGDQYQQEGEQTAPRKERGARQFDNRFHEDGLGGFQRERLGEFLPSPGIP